MLKKLFAMGLMFVLLAMQINANDYFSSANAIHLADQFLLYQRVTGGWPKDINMAKKLSKQEIKLVKLSKKNINDSTIDNDATVSQIKHLVQVYNATNSGKYKKAFLKGIDYLLEAQYDNGGWPQFYPLIGSYSDDITYNDDAIINVMELFKAIINNDPVYESIDAKRKAKCKEAFDKGLECILKSQYVQNGELTVWGQQHDPVTLAPSQGRAFEPPSLCSTESASILNFLMELDNPTPEIIKAVEGAVKWFDEYKIMDFKYWDKPDDSLGRGYERLLDPSPGAGPVWARLYELGTGKPIFGDRKNVVFYSMAELSYERRTGYHWYTDRAAKLLSAKYPAWQKKWTPDHSVLD